MAKYQRTKNLRNWIQLTTGPDLEKKFSLNWNQASLLSVNQQKNKLRKAL